MEIESLDRANEIAGQLKKISQWLKNIKDKQPSELNQWFFRGLVDDGNIKIILTAIEELKNKYEEELEKL